MRYKYPNQLYTAQANRKNLSNDLFTPHLSFIESAINQQGNSIENGEPTNIEANPIQL